MENGANLLHIEAMSNKIRKQLPAASLRDEVGLVLDAFEKAAGLFVCVRVMSDRWRDIDGESVFPRDYLLHRSPLCAAVKEQHLDRCVRCDQADLPKVCRAGRGPFVRACHAGVEEVLVPLWVDGVLVAVIFVGQFVRAAARRIRGFVPLRISREQGERVRVLTFTLQSYLHDLLRRLERQRQAESTGRRSVIERYIRQNLAAGPTIEGLAERLALSPSRTSHVVKEVMQTTFQQLVESQRLTIAKDLLTESDGKIAWVAAQSGFKDVAYFCRYFKTKIAHTPSAYRALRRREDRRV